MVGPAVKSEDSVEWSRFGARIEFAGAAMPPRIGGVRETLRFAEARTHVSVFECLRVFALSWLTTNAAVLSDQDIHQRSTMKIIGR